MFHSTLQERDIATGGAEKVMTLMLDDDNNGIDRETCRLVWRMGLEIVPIMKIVAHGPAPVGPQKKDSVAKGIL